jgi:hypothetical protein
MEKSNYLKEVARLRHLRDTKDFTQFDIDTSIDYSSRKLCVSKQILEKDIEEYGAGM